MERPAIHPGEVLANELEKLGVTPAELSPEVGVPICRSFQVIYGKRLITSDTAL